MLSGFNKAKRSAKQQRSNVLICFCLLASQRSNRVIWWPEKLQWWVVNSADRCKNWKIGPFFTDFLLKTRQKGLQSNSGPVRICFRLLASRRSDSELVATSYIALLLTAAGAAVKIIQYCLFFRKEIIGETMENASIYLFPFIIEYSIIGSSVIYNMWKSIGRLILWAIKDSVTELKTPSFSC